MSFEKDITEIRKISKQGRPIGDPLFKAASKEDLENRKAGIPQLTEDEKADVVRRVRKGLDMQFDSYPWTTMLKDIGLNPAEFGWAEEHLYYRVHSDDPTFPADY